MGRLNDLHVFDSSTMAWTDLTVAATGFPPSPRDGAGFAAAGGRLYVYGGQGSTGLFRFGS